MAKQQPNNRQQDRQARQARSDLWDMLNAFATTPDISRMHFANSVGELDVIRTDGTHPPKRIGFDVCAIATQTLDDDPDTDDEYDSDDVRPAEDFWTWAKERFGK